MFKTKASRQGRTVEARFRAKAEKAYEDYKIAKEIELTEKLKHLAEEDIEEEYFSDAMGMYIIDDVKDKREGGSESGSLQYVGAPKGSGIRKISRWFRTMYTEPKFELKWKEFMCITFYLQVPFSYMLRHVNMIYKWGALLVLTIYVFIGACIAMPVYMMLMFMGNYSRRSYIRFWECVPMLKGVAYSVALTCVLQEIFNVAFATLCLDYLTDILTSKDLPWAQCEFPGSSTDCQFRKVVNGVNRSCCIKYEPDCNMTQWKDTVFKYVAFDYFKRSKLHTDYTDTHDGKRLRLKLITMVPIVWFLILLMMLIGLKKFRGVMTTINLIIMIFIYTPFLLITTYYNKFNMFADLASNFTNVFNYQFWMELSVHSLHRELAGDVITFSAISSPGISTTVDTICIYTLKFMFLVLLTVWVSIGLTMLQSTYNVIETKCIHVDGVAIMYGLFPEVISVSRFAKPFLVIYFLVMFYWCFSATVYTLNSLIGALLEEFPKLVKFKFLICGLFCIACCVLNMFVIRPDLEVLFDRWVSQSYTHMKVGLLFFTLFGIYLYTLTRLSNDYHFTYGEKLNVFWIHGVKVAMLLTTVIVIVRVCVNYNELEIEDFVVASVIICPIILGAVIVIIKYKSGLKRTVINPDPRWGPPNFKTRLARNKFDPKRELRYKSALQRCQHSCLLRSTTLSREIKYWKNKRWTQCQVDME